MRLSWSTGFHSTSVERGEKGSESPWNGVEESLPLMLMAGVPGRLMRKKDAEQAHMQVEVVVNRPFTFQKHSKYWFPINVARSFPIPGKGSALRVILCGQTAFLDVAFVAVRPGNGEDISAVDVNHATERPAMNLISSISSTHLFAISVAADFKSTQADASVRAATSLLAPARTQVGRAAVGGGGDTRDLSQEARKGAKASAVVAKLFERDLRRFQKGGKKGRAGRGKGKGL
ncbi:hypothetical protein BJY52DRAFT_1229742 [Lactarius psammicola]|nr:hypothetical protein BJY52DRAFT_1229742 [Lactarius psammicola]